VHEVIWSDTALAQLDAIGIYLEQFNPKAAAEGAAHLLDAGNGLENFPHRGRLVPGTEMREIVTNYSYIIRYRVARDGTVRILRVRHTARRPTNP
jgi:plasmid stabilization system protein ParE